MSESNFLKLSPAQTSVAALKNLLLERQTIEKEVELKMYKLQYEYNKKYDAFSEKAKNIIEGKKVEEEDCKKFLDILPNDRDLSAHVGELPPFQSSDVSALKYYWFTVLKNHPQTKRMVCPPDEALLKHLTDVKAFQLLFDESIPEYPDYNGPALIIEFHFSNNDYFTNKILHKYFKLDFVQDSGRPYDFDGLVPVKMNMSKIDWLPDKDLTVKIVKKTQRNKKTKQIRVVNKSERLPSFFNYFRTYEEMVVDSEPVNENEAKVMLSSFIFSDYDLTSELASDMIPRSVIYYLNEDFEESDISDEDDIEEIDDNDNFDVYNGKNFHGHHQGNHGCHNHDHSRGRGHMSRH